MDKLNGAATLKEKLHSLVLKAIRILQCIDDLQLSKKIGHLVNIKAKITGGTRKIHSRESSGFPTVCKSNTAQALAWLA